MILVDCGYRTKNIDKDFGSIHILFGHRRVFVNYFHLSA